MTASRTVAAAEERRRRILAALRTSALTKTQLCERFGVSRATMTDALQRLLRDGSIIIVGAGAYAKYTAAEASCARSG